jgi:hypothetical protein
MPVRALRSLAGLVVLFCCSHRLLAQTDTTHVTLSGTVVDSDRKPLEGVEVRLVGDSTRHFSSASGTFRLYGPRGVELLLQFRRPGYNAQLLKVTGDWNGTVLMVTGAFALPDIQVNANNAKPADYAYTNKYDDFFRRRRQGLGDFIPRAEIDKRNAVQTTEIFEGRPGIKVNIQRDRGLASVSFVRCNEYPPRINVYVDGHKLLPSRAFKEDRDGSQSPFMNVGKPRDPEIASFAGEMLGRINPRDIELIEIFRGPGELPPEFNDGNCGAIVIWMREGGS